MVMAGARLCTVCSTPVELHAACLACGRLAGPGHEIPAPGMATFGLCASCARETMRFWGTRRVRARVDVEAVPRQRSAPRLLDTSQVARRLGVVPQTVRRYASTGKLQAVPLPGDTHRSRGGRRLRFVEADIEALAQSGARPRE
jgi:hypothetical protein